jgi:hypothetical protein
MPSDINALIAGVGGPAQPGLDVGAGIQNALRNRLMQQQIESDPYRRQLDERALRLQSLALDIKAKAMEQGAPGKPITLDYPTFTLSGESQSVAEAADMVAKYPDQANDPGFMPWLANRGVTFKRKETKAVEAPKTRTRQEGAQEITEEWTGTEWKKIGGGPKWNPKEEGFDISMDKEGNVRITKGAGGGGAAGQGAMTKPTQTKIEGKLFDSTNSLARLQKIEEAFKPEFMTWKTRLGQEITSGKAKLGMDVSPEERQARVEFVTFKRRAMSNLNQYLNELSGAAITEQEAKRLTQAMPDAEKDDPIEFESKMRDIIEEAKLGIIRYKYLLASGWTDEQIVGSVKKSQVQSIGAFRSQIQARGKEIAEEEKQKGTYPGDIPGIIKEKIRQEFKL